MINIERMGESTLKSHMKGEKHKRNAGATSSSTQSVLMVSFSCKGGSSSCDQSSQSGPSCAEANNDKFFVPQPPPAADGQSTVKFTDKERGTLANFVGKNHVLTAEILWTLQTKSAQYSYKSNKKVGKIFQAMFPDGAIASKFACSEEKTAYLCAFGLAKHFKELLMDEVKGAFTNLFDKSLNTKSQQKQMDIHGRFWA